MESYKFEDGTIVVPMRGRVLVKRKAKKDKSEGGIHLPDTAKEKPLVVKILAVGPANLTADGAEIPRPDVRPGDECFVGRYSGTELEAIDEDVLVVPFEELLAKVS